MKKIASFALALAMMTTMSTAALAISNGQVYETDNGLEGGKSLIKLQVKQAQDVLIATVPTELPIVIDTRGNITVPTTAKIVNKSDKKIKVSKVNFSTNSNNVGVTLTTDSNVAGTSTKSMSINFNGYSTREGTNHDLYIDFGNNAKMNIEPNQELPLTMDVKCTKPVYSTVISSSTAIGYAQFTIAFA